MRGFGGWTVVLKNSVSNEDWQFLTFGDSSLGRVLDELVSTCQGRQARSKMAMSGVEGVYMVAAAEGVDPDPEDIRLFELFDQLNLDHKAIEAFVIARGKVVRGEQPHHKE